MIVIYYLLGVQTQLHWISVPVIFISVFLCFVVYSTDPGSGTTAEELEFARRWLRRVLVGALLLFVLTPTVDTMQEIRKSVETMRDKQ